MNPNNPPLSGDINILIWGVTFAILVVIAMVLAFLSRGKE